MTEYPFLHEHQQFKDLIQIVSDKLNVVPQLVEKDYWTMHSLWGMQQNMVFELKGGSSWSKGFQVIDRSLKTSISALSRRRTFVLRAGPRADECHSSGA